MTGALVLVAFAGLVGCTPQPPDPDELQRWMNERQAEESKLGLANLTGLAEKGESPTEGEGISAGFEEPRVVNSLEFSCTGSEAMTVSIAIEGNGTSTSSEQAGLKCDESPHYILQSQNGVTKVTANASSADGFGAWAVVVVGPK